MSNRLTSKHLFKYPLFVRHRTLTSARQLNFFDPVHVFKLETIFFFFYFSNFFTCYFHEREKFIFSKSGGVRLPEILIYFEVYESFFSIRSTGVGNSNSLERCFNSRLSPVTYSGKHEHEVEKIKIPAYQSFSRTRRCKLHTKNEQFLLESQFYFEENVYLFERKSKM